MEVWRQALPSVDDVWVGQNSGESKSPTVIENAAPGQGEEAATGDETQGKVCGTDASHQRLTLGTGLRPQQGSIGDEMCAAPELSGRVVTGWRTSQQPYTLVIGSRPQQEGTEVNQRNIDDERDEKTDVIDDENENDKKKKNESGRKSESINVSNMMMRMRAAERVDRAVYEKKKSKAEETDDDDDNDNDGKKNGNPVETPGEHRKPVETPGDLVEMEMGVSESMSEGVVRDDENKDDDGDREKHARSDEKDDRDGCDPEKLDESLRNQSGQIQHKTYRHNSEDTMPGYI